MKPQLLLLSLTFAVLFSTSSRAFVTQITSPSPWTSGDNLFKLGGDHIPSDTSSDTQREFGALMTGGGTIHFQSYTHHAGGSAPGAQFTAVGSPSGSYVGDFSTSDTAVGFQPSPYYIYCQWNGFGMNGTLDIDGTPDCVAGPDTDPNYCLVSYLFTNSSCGSSVSANTTSYSEGTGATIYDSSGIQYSTVCYEFVYPNRGISTGALALACSR